jgi:hypothetical protein
MLTVSIIGGVTSDRFSKSKTLKSVVNEVCLAILSCDIRFDVSNSDVFICSEFKHIEAEMRQLLLVYTTLKIVHRSIFIVRRNKFILRFLMRTICASFAV